MSCGHYESLPGMNEKNDEELTGIIYGMYLEYVDSLPPGWLVKIGVDNIQEVMIYVDFEEERVTFAVLPSSCFKLGDRIMIEAWGNMDYVSDGTLSRYFEWSLEQIDEEIDGLSEEEASEIAREVRQKIASDEHVKERIFCIVEEARDDYQYQ